MTELYLGGIEKYNSKLENYDAIVMLEVIEHLEPEVLSRFGVVTLGTYRPRLLLVTTPVSFILFGWEILLSSVVSLGIESLHILSLTGYEKRILDYLNNGTKVKG